MEDKDTRDRENQNMTSDEMGRKGGSASMTTGAPYVAGRETVAFWTRDLIRWGPIWAGLLLALAIQVYLALLV